MSAQMLTTFHEEPGGLRIELNREHMEDIQELVDKYSEGKINHYQMWWELNERNFCNGYHEVADQYKGLTEAPMIANGIIDEETTTEDFEQTLFWYYPDYMIKDCCMELIERGEVFFPKL